MKNLKKALVLLLCAVLLVAGSVMGTLAYLTSQSETVVNTMTIGEVKITLDEADVTEYGVVEGTERVIENTYKLIPGHTYTKDPIVHVDAKSEYCYLYVKVDNPLNAIEDKINTIAAQMAANGWTLLTNSDDTYYYKDICSAGDDITVFTSFKIDGEQKDLTRYADETIEVIAYAIQADGFTSAQDAWDANNFGA